MKVLVIKRDKLGDLLLATPMLAHLKASRPDVQLHLLTNDYNAWVRRWAPVNNIHLFDVHAVLVDSADRTYLSSMQADGVHPNNASPADQDAIAFATLAISGRSPWGGLCS
jgi:hypothetical protein